MQFLTNFLFSMLTSQGLVLATAMAVSAGTILLFDVFREKYFSPDEKHVLKSCLSTSGGNKKKKKRVQFADDVKDSCGNGEFYRKQRGKKSGGIEKINNSCGNEIQKMPANRRALYSGILRDRVHRTEYSY